MEVKQVFPLFEKGRLLKKEALDLIRDYAPDYFSILFGECGDGVVAGFPIAKAGEEITVGPGILKSGGRFLCVREEVLLPFDQYGQPAQITVKEKGGGESPDFRTECYEIALGPVSELGEGEYELGRFRLEKGARLRTYGDYKDFHDLATEFNTLNLIHVKYSCGSGSGLAPLILRMYGKGILASPKAEPLDLSFAAVCLNSPRVSADLLENYLCVRERTQLRAEGNPGWYQRLRRLYTSLAGGGELRQKPSGLGGKTVID